MKHSVLCRSAVRGFSGCRGCRL